MHDAGIGHLDLKPDNILLDKKNNPHICDFGRSLMLDATKSEKAESPVIIQEPARRGTEEYYPPEIKKESNTYTYDPFAVDIFSLGVVFFVGVTNSFPYSSTREHRLKNKHYLMLSSKFVNLIEHMTAENPTERLSIDEVLQHRYFKKCREPHWTQAFAA
eukprot:CAMPEP_0206201934 /NCGR_PEP_ID=MMETSP0166-20121206/11855_1 /ASSEMBLY_ACC=CAM_ASM_000260 /TAXON_ID=95228 /ORGANISM="Vannella robusta, Strain DIVA3 518/3/11/1/6" /LENGTH=159 /DNA_ID=CAMNT_0053620727 /DNA_START=387 /DNA_END=862 /DNA_ORIENTATION=+